MLPFLGNRMMGKIISAKKPIVPEEKSKKLKGRAIGPFKFYPTRRSMDIFAPMPDKSHCTSPSARYETAFITIGSAVNYSLEQPTSKEDVLLITSRSSLPESPAEFSISPFNGSCICSKVAPCIFCPQQGSDALPEPVIKKGRLQSRPPVLSDWRRHILVTLTG